MKKRICSLLLICSMLAGLLPQIVLPQAAAADTAVARDGFGLPTEEQTGITNKDILRNNPYGTLGWVPHDIRGRSQRQGWTDVHVPVEQLDRCRQCRAYCNCGI